MEPIDAAIQSSTEDGLVEPNTTRASDDTSLPQVIHR